MTYGRVVRPSALYAFIDRFAVERNDSVGNNPAFPANDISVSVLYVLTDMLDGWIVLVPLLASKTLHLGFCLPDNLPDPFDVCRFCFSECVGCTGDCHVSVEFVVMNPQR